MIRCEQVSKVYRTGSGEVRSLDGITLEVAAGEFVCVRGPSGCGKTTLLLALGGMLRPSTGKVLVDGQDLYALDARARSAFRASQIGFVFQMFHLVPYLNVLENVLLAACPGAGNMPRERAQALLDELGLGRRLGHRPGQLSTGERQRTAIARALINKPKVILADEPTGNLDPDNAAEVMSHLSRFRDAGGTVVLVTHGFLGEKEADRLIYLKSGRVFGGAPRIQPDHELSPEAEGGKGPTNSARPRIES